MMELLSDLSSWFFKSRMSFYGKEDLELPLYFAVLCWSYAIAGLFMLWTEPKWARSSAFPFRPFAFFLIFVQAPLSFLADYRYMSDDSYVHVIDRILATPAMALESTKIIAMIYNGVKPHVLIPYTLAIIFALWSFVKSQEAQILLDRDGFVLYHGILWHSYPLIASTIILIDFYLLGGYKDSARRLFSIEIHRLRLKRVD